MTEKRQKCWSCEVPQPDWPEQLHIEDCPEHDEETCMVCRKEREKELAAGD